MGKMKKLIGKVIDIIVWLISPKILTMDSKSANWWRTRCGGEIVGKKLK